MCKTLFKCFSGIPRACLKTYLKETPTQMFPVKFAKILKNTFFDKYLRTVATLSRLLGWVKVNKITERSSQHLNNSFER